MYTFEQTAKFFFWSHTESEDSKRSKLIFITRLCTFSAMFVICVNHQMNYILLLKSIIR